MYLTDLTKAPSHFRKGSSLVEAAIVFPLVIAICIVSITSAMSLYDHLKDNVVKHKEETVENYEKYEKSRLYISIYRDDFFIDHGCNDFIHTDKS